MAQTIAVQLLEAPVRLLRAAREHHDAVLREFRLLAVTTGPQGLPPRLVELIDLFGRVYDEPVDRVDQVVADAIGAGRASLDLAYDVTPPVVDALVALGPLLDEVDAFCDSGELITLPREPQHRAFSQWWIGQFRDQSQGLPARPWSARQT